MSNENNIAPIKDDLNIEVYDVDEIKQKIYTIRGKQVMVDRDLADLYHCKNGTKTINQAVKRNIERFPERFMFQLTEEENFNMWSQLGTTLENNKQKYRKKDNFPFVFTEQGVAMLATIIKTDVAVEISIKIMDAFVEMKHFLYNNSRILILDRKYIYHIGASLKDLGKKCFGITLIKYDGIIDDLLLKIEL